MLAEIIFYIFIFLFGIVIGSFLNVCIYRIPKHEDIVKTRSHCMSCGYQLKWYDMFPVFSYLFLRGRCRKCHAKLSVQYPLIEAANGILYVMIVWIHGMTITSILYCLLVSALLVISVIDFRTLEIPLGINIFILILGIVRVATDFTCVLDYVIGFLSVSVVLAILYYASKGRRCEADGRLWTGAWLEAGFAGILFRMHFRISHSYYPDEGIWRRPGSGDGTIPFVGSTSCSFVGKYHDSVVHGTTGFLTLRSNILPAW